MIQNDDKVDISESKLTIEITDEKKIEATAKEIIQIGANQTIIHSKTVTHGKLFTSIRGEGIITLTFFQIRLLGEGRCSTQQCATSQNEFEGIGFQTHTNMLKCINITTTI